MASLSTTNPAAPTESKSARKKKAKAEGAATPNPEPTSATESKGEYANGESATDSPYLKELHKFVASVRNLPQEDSNANTFQGTSVTSRKNW